MKKVYFKYGNGKTADLCQTAYNYREGGAKVITMNAANNTEIASHIETNGKKLLTLEPNGIVDQNLFLQGFEFAKEGIDVILVDNAHLLTENQVIEGVKNFLEQKGSTSQKRVINKSNAEKKNMVLT